MAQILKEGGEMLLNRYSLIRIGFGWERYSRQYSSGFLGAFFGGLGPESADCDGSAVLFDRDGKPIGGSMKTACIYYGNTNLYDFAVVHNGDNLTGRGAGDDESIFFDLQRMPEEVCRIALTFDFFKSGRRMRFGKLQEVYVRAVEDASGEELCRFDPGDTGSVGKAMLAAWLYRGEKGWSFRAEGRMLPEAQEKEDLLKISFSE